MRNLSFLFFSLLLITAIAASLVYLPGQAVFTVAGQTVEMNLLLFILLSYLVISLIKALLQAPGKLRAVSRQRRSQQEKRLLNEGMRCLLTGDWKRAERLLSKGAQLCDRPLLYHLGAAEAAYRQDPKRCRKHMDAAMHSEPEAELSTAILRSRMYQSEGEIGKAIECLQPLPRRYPKNRLLDERLLELKLEQRDWEGVLEQLERLRLPAQKSYELKAQAFEHLLFTANPSQKPDDVERIWQRVPAKLKRDARTIKSYTISCLRGSLGSSCEPMLKKALKRRYDPELALLYGMVPSRKPAQQLRFMEQMLEKQPQEPMLLLAAGLLSARMQLWGKARSYLESSQKLAPRAETCRAIATLLERQGNHAEAARNYRKGLELLLAKMEPGTTQSPGLSLEISLPGRESGAITVPN